jgi:hypothetical protein
MSRVHVVFDHRGEVLQYERQPPTRVPSWGHSEDELELRALVGLAWERRGGPDFRAAVEAVVDWHDRRQIRAWERKQRQLDYLVQVLRETDPARSRREAAA